MANKALLPLRVISNFFSRSEMIMNWESVLPGGHVFLNSSATCLYIFRSLPASVFFLGCCLSMTQTSLRTHAGLSPTFRMVPMTKFKLLLTRESVAGWWSYSCTPLILCRNLLISKLLGLLIMSYVCSVVGTRTIK